MSGSDWGYFYRRCYDAAHRLLTENDPMRRALGEHMKKIAHAMHEIEWVDGGDSSSPDDTKAIMDVFGDVAKQKELDT